MLAWKEGDPLESGSRTAQIRGKERMDAAALGWDEPLRSYRPCLSYNELGSMLDEGPSKLYDGLAAILGLEDLVTSQDVCETRASPARKARRPRPRCSRRSWPRCARRSPTTIARARWWRRSTARTGTSTRSSACWRERRAPTEDHTAVGTLQRLAALTAPAVDDVAKATDRLRKAEEAQHKVAGTIASRARQLSDLLDKALAFHDTHGDGGCPVCDREGALNKQWHEKKKKEASAFREAATAATAAGSEAEAARKAALALAVPSMQTVERARPASASTSWVRPPSRACPTGSR